MSLTTLRMFNVDITFDHNYLLNTKNNRYE